MLHQMTMDLQHMMEGRAIEKAMEESGMEYVVIRSMVFMDNLTRFLVKTVNY